MNKSIFSILLPVIVSFFPLCAFGRTALSQERVIKNQQIELWTETFGESKHPAILLIMGAGASGIFWPNSLCEKLSQGGYFVIRYDHRDVGKSSLIDYQKHPYTLDDLAKDALAILDAYEIKKAHVIGVSMGGFIGQILAIKHPERLYTLVSMASSPDHSVMLAALAGKDTNSFSLPPPPQEALKTWEEMKLASIQTKEDRILLNLKNWKLCSGVQGYEEKEFRNLEERNIARTKSFTAMFNHWPAMASCPSRLEELRNVKIPTLVVHGGNDIVFPLEHGIATSKAIPGSTLMVISDMGHAMCDFFSGQLASMILLHIKNHTQEQERSR